jgi:asparagine synthase (glutamine-hydrolysing)
LCVGESTRFHRSEGERLSICLVGEVYESPFGTSLPDLLSRYRECGRAFVRELNGSFVLALLDEEREELVVATDRLATRKLFMLEDAEKSMYSTEIASLASLASTPDRTGVASYLANGCFVSGRTPFEAIRTVAPGTLRIHTNGRLEEERYWRQTFTGEYEGVAERSVGDELRDHLVHAVRLRYDESAPTALSLSAGYDATTILGILKRVLRAKDIDCFSYAHGPIAAGTDEAISQALAAEAGYSFRIIPSFSGQIARVLDANAALGKGIAPVCYEVDAWRSLRRDYADQRAASVFVGDECFGWIDRPLRAASDVLRAVQLNGLEVMPWLTQYCEGSTVVELQTRLERELAEVLGRQRGGTNLHDAKDDLYVTERLCHMILPWRECFAGNVFSVRNPFLDYNILDFVGKLAARQRRGKVLFKRTARRMSPELFRYPRARAASAGSYWERVLSEQAGALARALEEKSSPLDAVIPRESLVRILLDLSGPLKAREATRVSVIAKTKRYLGSSTAYDTLIRVWPLPRMRVSRATFVARAMVLRAFLLACRERTSESARQTC